MVILINISQIHQQFGYLQSFRPTLLSFLVRFGLAVLKRKYMDWQNLKEMWHPKAIVVLLGIALFRSLWDLHGGLSGLLPRRLLEDPGHRLPDPGLDQDTGVLEAHCVDLCELLRNMDHHGPYGL